MDNNFDRKDYKDENILKQLRALMLKDDQNPDLNWSVFTDWLNGYTQTSIAKRNEKSNERVRQIIHKSCRRYDRLVKQNSVDVNDTAVDKQNFSVRVYNGLYRAGINDLKQLGEMTEEKFYKIRNIGKSSAKEVLEAMKLHNIQFKEPEPDEEEHTQERFCDKPVDIKTYVKNHGTSLPTTRWEENYCVTNTEWEYSCPVYKVLEEMILALQEQLDNANIIKRDVYDNTLPSVDMCILVGDIGETLQHYRDKIKQIPMITVSYDTTMEHKDEMINTLRDVANKYSINIKFCMIENTELTITLPTSILVSTTEDICTYLHYHLPVSFKLGNVFKFEY